jgi:disulfide bond formation protein DsbB
MTPTINAILSILTLSAQIFLIGTLLFFIFFPAKLKKISKKFLSDRNVTWAIFIVSLLATTGSLFYSQVAHFVPCELCWFQRIFMYPQVILAAIALFKKENKIFDYSLALASIGAIISLYQNYLIYTATRSAVCLISSTSCTTKFVLGLGYVTIPLMALTAFILIIAIFLLQKINDKRRN